MVPPGPIPNPEVKHQHVDGSRTIGPARVDSCQGSNEGRKEKSLRPFPFERSFGVQTPRRRRIGSPIRRSRVHSRCLAATFLHYRHRRFFTTPGRAFFTASVSELSCGTEVPRYEERTCCVCALTLRLPCWVRSFFCFRGSTFRTRRDVLLPSSQVASGPPHGPLTPACGGKPQRGLASRPYSRRASCRTIGPARPVFASPGFAAAQLRRGWRCARLLRRGLRAAAQLSGSR